MPIRLWTGEEAPRPGRAQNAPELVRRYLAFLSDRVERDEYSKHAYEDARRDLGRFAEFLGDRQIEQARQADLADWLEANPQWRSVETRKRVISYILTCYRWGAYEGHIEACPYSRPRALVGVPSPTRRPAERGEYVTLMRFGSRAMRRALYFLRRTGARTCEMREIRWPEVNLEGASPHIAHVRHKQRRKTKLPRKIGLDAGVVRFLRNLRRQAPPGADHVFLNCDGRPWNRHTFCQQLRRLVEAVGLDLGAGARVTGYCLRHSYTVEAIEAGIGERQIADQLGHGSTEMIGRVYGSHTRQREGHLANVAGQIHAARRKRPGRNDSSGKPA